MSLVWCLLVENDRALLGDVFSAACDPGLDIDGLKTRIKDLAPKCLQDEPALDLTVYHSSAINADMDDDELKAAILQLDFNEAEVSPADVVTEVVSGHELLILKKSAPRISSKRLRSHSPEIGHFSPLKLCFKTIRETPSQVAEISDYMSLQADPSERILDDRPQPDLGIAPISLLYGPFGEFDDIFCGRMPPPADIRLDYARLTQQVDELATAMSFSYPTDYERRSSGVHLIQGMFNFPLVEGGSKAHGIVTTIATFRNAHSSAPYFDSVKRIVRSQLSSDAFKGMCNQWRTPALCIAIDGSKIHFYAILLLGHQYRVLGLTPGLSWSPLATNGRDREHLYSAFAAAYVLQQRIHRDLDSYIQSSELIPSVRDWFLLPAVSKIRKHGRDADDHKYIEFEILEPFVHMEHNRHLYYAQVRNGTVMGQHTQEYMLVKFSRRYSIDLHDFCAEKGHAPRIFGYERLPGGWFAIAMDWLAHANYLDQCYSKQKEEALVDLVNGFHEKDLVHGDLRSANILCDESSEQFWVIDFDWGGKAGEVEYPTWLLNEELTTGRQAKDLKIRKEDDLRILRATLDALKCQ